MEVNLGDRVWLLGHNREGVIVAVEQPNGRTSVATLNRLGERVVYDMARSEIARYSANILTPAGLA